MVELHNHLFLSFVHNSATEQNDTNILSWHEWLENWPKTEIVIPFCSSSTIQQPEPYYIHYCIIYLI